MKSEQKLNAKNLFLGTNLTQQQIADQVGVNRKTVRFWSQQDNWTRIRQAERTMPSIVTEKCYYMIDQFITRLLSERNSSGNFSYKDADFVNTMATAIKKMKARTAINESMEMFGYFLSELKQKDGKMAEAITPFIEDYFDASANTSIKDFSIPGYDEQGSRLWADEEKEITEQWQNEKDDEEIMQAILETRLATEHSKPKDMAAQKPPSKPSADDDPEIVIETTAPETPPFPSSQYSVCNTPTEDVQITANKVVHEYDQLIIPSPDSTSTGANNYRHTSDASRPENGTFLGHFNVDKTSQTNENQQKDTHRGIEFLPAWAWDFRPTLLGSYRHRTPLLLYTPPRHLKAENCRIIYRSGYRILPSKDC